MTAHVREVLCVRSPAVLHCADLRKTLDFYTHAWQFDVLQIIPGVMAVIRRESVCIHLMQRRSDMAAEVLACRLLVDDIDDWKGALGSAAGQAVATLTEEPWGFEWCMRDCDGHRLHLVQPAPHAVRRQMRE